MGEARLEQVVETLRAQRASSGNENELRARIVEQALRRQARRRHFKALKLAIAMLLVAPTAWAAVKYVPGVNDAIKTGAEYVHARFSGAVRETVDARSAVRSKKLPSTQLNAAVQTERSADAPLPAMADEAGEAQSVPAGTSEVVRKRFAEGSPELFAYELAHEAHFKQQEFHRAVQLWRRYLKTYPRGRFAPEAEFNLGVALLSLDHTEEARSVLQQAISNPQLDYRKPDIERLLDTLSTDVPQNDD